MHKMDGLLHLVDSMNKLAGRTVAWLVPVLMLTISYEVIMRYLFRAPTIWAWDVSVQLFAVILFFGGGYLLLHEGHVRVDVIYSRLSKRWQVILDLITFPIFLLYVVILFWKFIVVSRSSIASREVTNSLFAPPIYPLKVIMTLAVFFLLMQGVAKFIRDLRAISVGKK
jgi:TRAP-type mannitol/chloroaromatic compound transport system permease small subunit